jgi:sigma-70-like protein
VWSAESAALADEERREVLAAVARLPRRQREVLVLRYFLGLSDSEIAADLGCLSADRVAGGEHPVVGQDLLPALGLRPLHRHPQQDRLQQTRPPLLTHTDQTSAC